MEERLVKFYTAKAIPPCQSMMGEGVKKVTRLPRRYYVFGECLNWDDALFWFDKLCDYKEEPFVLVVEFLPWYKWEEAVFTPDYVPREWMERVKADMQVFLSNKCL